MLYSREIVSHSWLFNKEKNPLLLLRQPSCLFLQPRGSCFCMGIFWDGTDSHSRGQRCLISKSIEYRRTIIVMTLPSGSVWRSHLKVMITAQNITSSQHLFLGFIKQWLEMKHFLVFFFNEGTIIWQIFMGNSCNLGFCVKAKDLLTQISPRWTTEFSLV